MSRAGGAARTGLPLCFGCRGPTDTSTEESVPEARPSHISVEVVDGLEAAFGAPRAQEMSLAWMRPLDLLGPRGFPLSGDCTHQGPVCRSSAQISICGIDRQRG